jgi:hypothetical protein
MPTVINLFERTGAIQCRFQKGACAVSKRISIALAIVLVLALTGGVWLSASASGAVVPFKGYYIAHPKVVGVDSNGCLIQQMTGEGNATHLGASTWVSEALSCPATWLQTGDITFTAANGDELMMDFSGTFSFDQSGNATFKGDYTITGGTGRLKDSGGTGAYWGMAVPNSVGEISFKGTFEKP